MESVVSFIGKTFNINVLVLFLLASMFLLMVDTKEYKKKNYVKESRMCKVVGYMYIVLGLGLYIAARLIKI